MAAVSLLLSFTASMSPHRRAARSPVTSASAARFPTPTTRRFAKLLLRPRAQVGGADAFVDEEEPKTKDTFTYAPTSGNKFLGDDYLVKKVSAKELEELVRSSERKVPLILDFYATWCGPCILMAQELEMLAVEYEDNALFVKIDTDDEYEFARDMQIRGLPTLYFFGPKPNKGAIRVEGLVPKEMIQDIIDNQL